MRRSRARGSRRAAALGLAAALGAALVAEMAARLAHPEGLPEIVPELAESYRTYLGELRRPRFAERPSPAPSSRLLPPEPRPRMPKPRDLTRVVCLGESTVQAHGWFTAALREELERRRPGAAWEVVNAGVGAIDAEGLERVFRETLAFSPDLVVVYFGHNVNIRHPGLPAWRYALLRLAGRSALARWVVRKARGGLGEERPEARTLRALSGIAALSRRRGLPVVLCIPAANLLFPPDPDPALRLPGIAEAYGRGLYLLEARRWEGARRAFAAVAARSPEAALPRFQLGRCAAALGRREEARRHFDEALGLNTRRDRATPALARTLRSFARSNGLWMADVDAAFRAAARGAPGFGLFSDHCHPRWRGHLLIARTIARELESRGWGGVRGARPPWAVLDPAPAADPPGAPFHHAVAVAKQDQDAYQEPSYAVLGWALKADPRAFRRGIEGLSDEAIGEAGAFLFGAQARRGAGEIRDLIRLYAAVAARREVGLAMSDSLLERPCRSPQAWIRAHGLLQRSINRSLSGRPREALRLRAMARDSFEGIGSHLWYHCRP